MWNSNLKTKKKKNSTRDVCGGHLLNVNHPPCAVSVMCVYMKHSGSRQHGENGPRELFWILLWFCVGPMDCQTFLVYHKRRQEWADLIMTRLMMYRASFIKWDQSYRTTFLFGFAQQLLWWTRIKRGHRSISISSITPEFLSITIYKENKQFNTFASAPCIKIASRMFCVFCFLKFSSLPNCAAVDVSISTS